MLHYLLEKVETNKKTITGRHLSSWTALNMVYTQGKCAGLVQYKLLEQPQISCDTLKQNKPTWWTQSPRREIVSSPLTGESQKSRTNNNINTTKQSPKYFINLLGFGLRSKSAVSWTAGSLTALTVPNKSSNVFKILTVAIPAKGFF